MPEPRPTSSCQPSWCATTTTPSSAGSSRRCAQHSAARRSSPSHLTRCPAAKLHNYRRALQLSETQIRWTAYAGHQWRINHPNTVDLLQLADATASALVKAVDPDQYGNTEERYLRALAPKLYRRGAANIISYGLKVFPTSECKKGGTLEFLRAL